MRDIHNDESQHKHEAQQLLLRGKSVKDIMTMYPKRYTKTTLGNWKAELIADRDHESMEKIAHVDTDTIERLALLADSKGFYSGATKLRSVAKGLTSLQRLEPIVHHALEKAVKVAEQAFDKHMDEEDDYTMTAGEFKIYMDCIVNANTALFNRPSNQINVLQQTNVDNRVVQNAVTDRLQGLLKGVFPDDDATDTIEGEVDDK